MSGKVCSFYQLLLNMEEEMATHSSILAWKIAWTEKPGGLQSMGLQRVRQDCATEHICIPWTGSTRYNLGMGKFSGSRQWATCLSPPPCLSAFCLPSPHSEHTLPQDPPLKIWAVPVRVTERDSVQARMCYVALTYLKLGLLCVCALGCEREHQKQTGGI